MIGMALQYKTQCISICICDAIADVHFTDGLNRKHYPFNKTMATILLEDELECRQLTKEDEYGNKNQQIDIRSINRKPPNYENHTQGGVNTIWELHKVMMSLSN